MTTILEMIVNMDCPGCESKVKKSLQKLDGVDNVDIDMELQKVTVTGWAEQEKILKTVRRTGRKADLWPFPCNIPEYTSTEYFYDQYNYHSDPSSYFSSDHSSTDYLYQHQYANNVEQYDREQHEYGHGYYDNGLEHGRGGYNYNYNYNYNHGQQRLSSSVLGGMSNTMFSDENVNACSIM